MSRGGGDEGVSVLVDQSIEPGRGAPATSASSATAAPGKGLRILFHMLGDRNKASSRVRGYWIIDELERLGHVVTVFSAAGKADYLRLAAKIAACDVVVFQKRYSRYDTWLVRLARALGKRAYFDIDDAPSRIANSETMRNAARMMRLSDGVLAGCDALARLSQVNQPRTHLVPSGVKLENYPLPAPRPTEGAICLGWIGNGAHYAEDLVSMLEGPVRAIAMRHKIRLKIVGACGEPALYRCFDAMKGLEVELVDQIAWSDPAAVASAISSFDIGLYPLRETEFNRFKCAFKALEYMAMGLPVVASRVGANADVVVDGETGILVDGEEEWTAALERLIGDPALRHAMGAAGRERVERDFSTGALAARVAMIVSGRVGAPCPEAI